MAEILFVTWDGGGNLPPALGIALELKARGDSPTVLGHPRQRAAVEGAGLAFESFSTARPWNPTRPASTVAALWGFTGVFTDAGIAADAVALAGRLGSEVVVVDCLLFRTLRAVSEAGLRTVSLVHTLQRYLDRSTTRGPVGVVSTLRGARPGGAWACADLRLVCALPELDPAAADAVPGTVHVGPVWQGDPAPAHAPAADRSRPRVLVSLSTTWFPGQEQTLQTILDAVGPLDLDAIVTTGPAVDPSTLRAGPNTELRSYVDHGELMPTMSMVVSHGGHATAMRALSYDLPILVLPMHPLLDQAMVGQAIASAGAGQVLARTATTSQIAAAITHLAGPGPHRTAAACLGDAIRRQDGAVAAANQIQVLTPTH